MGLVLGRLVSDPAVDFCHVRTVPMFPAAVPAPPDVLAGLPCWCAPSQRSVRVRMSALPGSRDRNATLLWPYVELSCCLAFAPAPTVIWRGVPTQDAPDLHSAFLASRFLHYRHNRMSLSASPAKSKAELRNCTRWRPTAPVAIALGDEFRVLLRVGDYVLLQKLPSRFHDDWHKYE